MKPPLNGAHAPNPDQLFHQIKRLAIRVGHLNQDFEDLLAYLADRMYQADALKHLAQPGGAPERLRRRRKPTLPLQVSLRAAAGLHVSSVALQPDGSTVFRLEGLEVALSPRLAFLLEVLSADDRPSPDHLVGWRSRAEVKERFLKQFGVAPNAGALNTLVYRLRIYLSQRVPWWGYCVVQHPTHGLRFACRRRAAPDPSNPGAPPSNGSSAGPSVMT